jgi:hypothetical protein
MLLFFSFANDYGDGDELVQGMGIASSDAQTILWSIARLGDIDNVQALPLSLSFFLHCYW